MNSQASVIQEGTKEEAAVASGQGSLSQAAESAGFLEGASHPVVCLFHMGFKALAILFYCLFGLFSDDYMLCYILVMTTCALDFWTVKNVSGR